MIAHHSAGYVSQGYPPERHHLTGTYTATTTGLHTLNIHNYRNANKTDLFNYIDDIKFSPDTTNFAISDDNISIATGGGVQLLLDAGSNNANAPYLVLMSGGSHPGFSYSGVHIHLNMDNFFNLSRNMANGPIFQNTLGTLDASGQATAVFNVPGPVSPVHLGKHYTFAYVLTQSPGKPPVTFASYPVLINFIP